MTPEADFHYKLAIETDWLKRWAQYSPNHIALQCAIRQRKYTYQQLHLASHRLAGALALRFQIVTGDRVACLAQNELESIALFFACQRLGAILVPVNFRFTAPEIGQVLGDSGAKLFIRQRAYADVAAAAVSCVVGSDTSVWNFDGENSLMDVCQSTEGTGLEMPVQGHDEDPCLILYTSGTTGFPKGVMISRRMIFWNSINTGLSLNLTQNDVVVTFLPLFHTGGWNVLTTPCLHRGARVILLSKFDPEIVLNLCESERVTVLFGVPTTMDLMRRSPSYGSRDLSSIRYAVVGGEPMALDLIRAWQERGIAVRQGYGLTEFGPNVFSLSQEDSERKMGSIGFPNFYVDAKIVDEAGRECATGEVGELLLRGPAAMSGYWRNPAATATTMGNGWVHTGDLVCRDIEGYFYVVGRKKEMFISGGENVYPAEVERVLRQLEGVREAAVVGVSHAKWGECGRAFIAVEAGKSLCPEDLRSHCTQYLAKFKVPQEFVILDDLPKTESGKIAKNVLSQWRVTVKLQPEVLGWV